MDDVEKTLLVSLTLREISNAVCQINNDQPASAVISLNLYAQFLKGLYSSQA